MNPLIQCTQAFDFAARRHVHQRRKGKDAEPYLNHLAEVACLLAEATGGQDPSVVIAGILHDTIEDTGTTHGELVQLFGPEVADLVKEVTDDKTLPKATRKRLQIETAAHKSGGARMIKIADKISNLRALALSPPADWSHERRVAYFDWAHAVVAGCRGINDPLERAYDAAYADGVRALSAGAERV